MTAVYDDNIFIARVNESKDTHSMLSFMTPPGLTGVKWPRKPDKLSVRLCDILAVVQSTGSSSARRVGLTPEDIVATMDSFHKFKAL